MLTENEILEIANSYVQETGEQINVELIISQESIIKKPYGNIYFYTNKKYYESRDAILAGNAPFLVEKKTGNIIVFGTAHMEDYYIEEYEAGRWPKNERESSSDKIV